MKKRSIKYMNAKQMVNVFYWNINGRDEKFCPTLKKACSNADIIVLSESKIDDSTIESKLGFKRVPLKSTFDENIWTPRLYTNLSLTKIEHFSSAPSKRLVHYLINTREYGEILLCGIHFPSKASYNGDTQMNFAINYNKWLTDIEKLRKHKNTIVFGDFNMNPFEAGMIQPNAFNATLSYQIAKSGLRTSHFDDFEYFYNPMWNWLGDREYKTGNFKLPGSFYFKDTSDVNEIYWNVFDKVIVRPSLIDAIEYGSIKVHEAIPISDLVNHDPKNTPDYFTDHQPLSFKLKISIL